MRPAPGSPVRTPRLSHPELKKYNSPGRAAPWAIALVYGCYCVEGRRKRAKSAAWGKEKCWEDTADGDRNNRSLDDRGFKRITERHWQRW